MKIKEVLASQKLNLEGLEPSCFLLGLISAFENRFQEIVDRMMEEVSWKQFL